MYLQAPADGVTITGNTFGGVYYDAPISLDSVGAATVSDNTFNDSAADTTGVYTVHGKAFIAIKANFDPTTLTTAPGATIDGNTFNGDGDSTQVPVRTADTASVTAFTDNAITDIPTDTNGNYPLINSYQQAFGADPTTTPIAGDMSGNTGDGNTIAFVETVDTNGNPVYTFGTAYTVTYDPAGGTVSPTTETVLSGGQASLPTPTAPAGSGASFVGWFDMSVLSPTGTGTDWGTQGLPLEPAGGVTKDVTLTAVWYTFPTPPTTFTIVFDANAPAGATATGTTADLVVGPDADGAYSFTVPDVGFSIDGYTFAGWNEYADGSGDTLQPGELWYVDSSAIPDGSGMLYAMWTQNGGGGGGPSAPTGGSVISGGGIAGLGMLVLITSGLVVGGIRMRRRVV